MGGFRRQRPKYEDSRRRPEPAEPGDAELSSDQLGYLQGVSKQSVHKVGTDAVHGVKATHYNARIDWDKALADNKLA